MADHYITDDELKAQAETVRDLLRKLDEKLSPGEYRRLTKEEVEKLC